MGVGFAGDAGDDVVSAGDTGVLFLIEDGGLGIVGSRMSD